MDRDRGSRYNFSTEIFLSQCLGGQLCSKFGSYVDSSLDQSRFFYVPGSLALQEAFNRISKFAGELLFLFTSGSNHSVNRSLSGKQHDSSPGGFQSYPHVKHIISCKHNLVRFCSGSVSRAESSIQVFFGKIAHSTMTHITKELEHLQSIPVLSLASALVPPFDNLPRKVLAMPLENSNVLINGHANRSPCMCGHQGFSDLTFHERNWPRHAVEPVTGIDFPTVLDNIFDGGNNSISNEVLVGTGSKSMRIFKVKSLKVYAFGLYVQPDSICKKLGAKYASVPVNELNNQPEFFDDLLREDIHMTVRLVVNCNGLKISAVRDAFEKSLRTRLLKMNPNTDYHCLRTFDSYFSQDIPIPPGTTIDFQQTAEGQLITEIGGKQIGAVHSKDLCRAFFGMYIGDIPVSLQTKEEIAKNVGSIIKRC